MTTEATPVIFRMIDAKYPELIALFPLEAGGTDGWTCQSFMHFGQHGPADPNIVSRSRLATPTEYADVKRELEAAPYGYRLEVIARFPRNSFDVRYAQTHRA